MAGPLELDKHLTYEYTCTSAEELRGMVDKLLAADTCFAVIGGELRLRFHDRGAEALGMTIDAEPVPSAAEVREHLGADEWLGQGQASPL